MTRTGHRSRPRQHLRDASWGAVARIPRGIAGADDRGRQLRPARRREGALRDLNEDPTAYVMSTRTGADAGEAQGHHKPAAGPAAYVADVPRYNTNQVPNNLTQGTSNNASDLFTADWRQLYIGVRTELQITVLTERYADTGTGGHSHLVAQ